MILRPPTLAALCLLIAATPALAQSRASFLHTPVASAKSGQPVRVEGSLLGGSRIDKVRVKFRVQDGEWREQALELQYGDLYRGFIPGEEVSAPWLDYYVEGIQLDRSAVLLFASEKQPVRLDVTGETRRGSSPPARSMPARGRPKPESPRVQPTVDPDAEALAAGVEPAPGKSPERPAPTAPPRSAYGDEPSDPVPASPRESKRGSGRKKVDEKVEAVRSELEEELLLYGAEDTVALATRHEESVTRVPAVASSWTRAQIQALGARNVFEFLDFLPGFSVSRDVQGFYRLGVRGLRSDPEVLFLVNGHPMNNVFDGRALAALPVENIDRVEVIRGPGSAVFGAGAFLGVVNIITDTTPGLRASASGGLFDTGSVHAQGTAKVGSWRLSADAEGWTQAGARKPIQTDNLSAATLAQGLRPADQPAGSTNDRRLLFNGGLSASVGEVDTGRVGLGVRFLHENRGALVGLFDTVGPDSNLTWDALFGDVTYDRELGGSATLQLHAWADQQWADRTFQITPRNFQTVNGGPVSESGLLEKTLFTTRTLGLEGRVDLALGVQNRMTVGATVQHQSLPSYQYLSNYLPNSVPIATFEKPEGVVYPQEQGKGVATGRLSFALHAQDQWTPWERLSLTLGLRLDAVQLPTTGGTPEAPEITGSTLVPSFNPRAGLVFSATDRLVFKLLYGRAFRAPTVQELTESIPETGLNQGRFKGNPALRPPTVDAFELAVDHLQGVGGDARLRLRGNAFLENFLSPIARVDTSGNIVPLSNRQGVRVFGLEGEARLEAGTRASAFANASWFRAVDTETASQSQLLTDTPQARLNAGFSLPVGDWLNLDLSTRFTSERRNNARSVLELVRRYRIPASTVINAQLRTEKLWGHLELAGLVQNVFQQDTYDDPPRPDRMPGLIPREGLGAWLILRGNL